LTGYSESDDGNDALNLEGNAGSSNLDMLPGAKFALSLLLVWVRYSNVDSNDWVCAGDDGSLDIGAAVWVDGVFSPSGITNTEAT
jgi:hypothetical protein